MDGLTTVAGVTVNCKVVQVREVKTPQRHETIYLVELPTGQRFTVDNFTEEKND